MNTMSMLTSLLTVAARTLVIYAVVLIGLRLSGKREIGQMTVFDLVLVLLIANAVQNAMVGLDTSLSGGIMAALTLLVANSLIARLRLKTPRLKKWVEGSPTLLILRGKLISEHLNREGIDLETLMASLREHGVMEISDVEMAILENDGSISVIPKKTRLQIRKIALNTGLLASLPGRFFVVFEYAGPMQEDYTLLSIAASLWCKKYLFFYTSCCVYLI